MSLPISDCMVAKAVNDGVGSETYSDLVYRWAYNMNFGSFTSASCRHDPPCSIKEGVDGATWEKQFLVDVSAKRDELKRARR